MEAPCWKFWIDTGGTFTDCLAESPEGREFRVKVLSSARLRFHVRRLSDLEWHLDHEYAVPDRFFRGFHFRIPSTTGQKPVAVDDYSSQQRILRLSAPWRCVAQGEVVGEMLFPGEAPILAVRLVTGLAPSEPLPPMTIRLATTRGTNALLEGKGAEVTLYVTKGFGDLLKISTQQRPDLFDPALHRAVPYARKVVEIRERLAADGRIVEALALPDDQPLPAVAAISLLHSYKNNGHEATLAAHLRAAGCRHVSVSTELVPLAGYLRRTETTVVNAYLSPVLQEYLDKVAGELPPEKLWVMTSAGGLLRADHFHAKDSLLSGPAGGVVGAAMAGRRAGFPHLLAFDMGGTSTDVSRFEGDFSYRFRTTIGKACLYAPSLRIETVAAGGGSICSWDGTGLRAGPESAGADPGPACYGRGGPLALTDVHLLLGRIHPSGFQIPIDRQASERALTSVLEAMSKDLGRQVDRREVLRGFLAIANQTMADAIHKVSTAEGNDPSKYAMLVFGGAGGLHACALADILRMDHLIFPANAGLLSAEGLRYAVMETIVERQVMLTLEAFLQHAPELLKDMEKEAGTKLSCMLETGEPFMVRRILVSARLPAQESTLELDWSPDQDLRDLFLTGYRSIYGYEPMEPSVEVVSLRMFVSTCPVDFVETPGSPEVVPPPLPDFPSHADVLALYRRSKLSEGMVLEGPCLVSDGFSTLCVEDGWVAETRRDGALVLLRSTSGRKTYTGNQYLYEVEHELISSRMRTLVEEMGSRLQRTALSTNVKDRWDFSCALLDAEGYLVWNAPHIPVHLGALGHCVRCLSKDFAVAPGDVLVTNHPAFGGSHLPDITLVAPVFAPGGQRIGWLANRAHHAEIGGIAPGSMPPMARCLTEEGVVLSPRFLLRGGKPDWDGIRQVFTGSSWPTRRWSHNHADLLAQLASLQQGLRDFRSLFDEWREDRLVRHFRDLFSQAAFLSGRQLQTFGHGPHHALQHLDDQTPLEVSITISGERAIFDFTGTGGVHPGSFNATPGIVRSVVLYVLRCLVGEKLPLNEGLLDPVEIRLPDCLLNPSFPAEPESCPAVVAGNVEVSQRLVDTIFLALRSAACSQGTMNNVIYGNEGFSYYETVGGGGGAGPGYHGLTASHCHMTNTAITDPEILESRHPVRLHRFAVRHGSGGEGKWRGGDGVIREVEFLEDVELSLLLQRRSSGPDGLEGGGCGQSGDQYLLLPDGSRQALPGVSHTRVGKGTRLILCTPGGGGFGSMHQT